MPPAPPLTPKVIIEAFADRVRPNGRADSEALAGPGVCSGAARSAAVPGRSATTGYGFDALIPWEGSPPSASLYLRRLKWMIERSWRGAPGTVILVHLGRAAMATRPRSTR